jgi:hypothetical protein
MTSYAESTEKIAIAKPTQAEVYAKKLTSPLWQKKRLEVMEKAKFTCQLCGDEKTELHVHHPKYVYGKEPWDYENLVCLCKNCHAKFHRESPEIKEVKQAETWECVLAKHVVYLLSWTQKYNTGKTGDVAERLFAVLNENLGGCFKVKRDEISEETVEKSILEIRRSLRTRILESAILSIEAKLGSLNTSSMDDAITLIKKRTEAKRELYDMENEKL